MRVSRVVQSALGSRVSVGVLDEDGEVWHEVSG